MKKHIYIIIIILALALFVSAGNLKKQEKKLKIVEELTSETTATYYTLKDHNGRIALFISGEEKPREVYEILTDSLPETDAKKIKKGITVTADEIEKLLADYTS